MTLSSASILGASTPGSDGNEWGTLHSAKLLHYWNLTMRLFSVISWHSLKGSYPSAEKQSVYSKAPADWANLIVSK